MYNVHCEYLIPSASYADVVKTFNDMQEALDFIDDFKKEKESDDINQSHIMSDWAIHILPQEVECEVNE